ncbi:gliding motility-associated C-terminal domain-containing protein [Flavobacteriales bacterium]|nr:gliding motility-associated C-terminal domain-containing protein [Flavobacteriales bacterium]
MTRRLLYISLWGLLLILSQQHLFASHSAGMDISYECVSQGPNADTYKITVKYYRDCSSSTPAAPIFTFCNYISSCGSGTFTLPQISGPTFITSLCPGASTPCNNVGIVELEEYIYQTTISLNHCNDWVIEVCANGNRNLAISTINSPGTQELCVEAEINNSSICNNSPSFTEYPAPYICAGQSYCYNNGAIDVDGDSLVYSLQTPLSANGVVNYLTGYSSSNPISGTTMFDQITGDLCMNTTQAQVSVIAMKITEYRNGLKIGSVLRDIQIIVLSCSTTPPVLSGFNGIPQDVTNASALDDSLHFCANDVENIYFTINSSLGLSNNKIMSWSGINGAPSASFSITNNNTNNPTGTFNWTPQYSDVVNSPFTFTINIEDDACPVNNLFSYTYTITLSSNTSFNITYNQINHPSCIGYNDGNIDLTITGTIGLSTYDWTGPNFSSTNEDIDSLFSGTYNIVITDDAGCIITDNIDIIDPPGLNITAIIDSVNCVGGNNGSIDITVTPNNGTLTYSWTGPNGFSNNNEDINFLISGAYDLAITDASSGCVFNEVVIIPTPNPFNTNIVVDSISCIGYNDGAIDLTVIANSSSLAFNWTGPNGFTSTNEDINSLFAGTYNITITDAAGCMFVDSVFLYEPSNVSSLTLINTCDSYLWNSILYTTSGIYTYTSTASNGCDSTAILNLTINNSSTSTITITSCNGYTWNGNTYSVSGTYAFNTLNTAGCDSIANLNLTINNSSTSTTSIQDCNPYTWNGITYEASGIYSYITTNTIGCDSIATLELQITSYNINVASPICKYDSTEITITIVDPIVNEYTITINDLMSSAIYIVDSLGLLIPEGEPIKLTPEASTSFILESVIDINSCTNYTNDTAFVIVNQLPLVELDLSDICKNEPPFILDQGIPQGGIYLVDSNEVNVFEASNMQLGKHLVQYIYEDTITNCSNITEKEIIILPIPSADFYCDYYIIKQDTPITFFNTSIDYINLNWELGNGSFFQDSMSFTYVYEDPGTYNVQLIAINEYNCLDTAIKNISIIPSYTINIPSAFTPNGDKINDKFKPFGVGIKSYTIWIFNRWGENIFYKTDTPWLGLGLQDGPYTYIIEITNLKDMHYYYKGSVMLIN